MTMLRQRLAAWNRTLRLTRFFALLTALIALLTGSVLAVTAQQPDTAPPDEIAVALDALSQRTGETVTLDMITSYRWESRSFPDAGLGCPEPGEVYALVVTPGYQFLIDYAGTTYDYRVPENGSRAVLCDSFPAQSEQPMVTSVPTAAADCGGYYEVAPGEILLDIAERCGTTVDAIMAINPDIEDPSLIYAGQRLALPSMESPYNVSITPDGGPPGTSITITATGLPAGARVEYGLGRFRSEYDVFGTREVGADGTISIETTMPETADIGEEWVAVIVYNGEESVSEVFQVSETGLYVQAQVYLVAPGDAGRSGRAIGCDDSLIPVTVDIQPTLDPVRPALNALLDIDTRVYGQSGLYNALYRSDLTVSDIGIRNGIATVELAGDLNMGGVCDVPRIEQQLRQTALQFPSVDRVIILVNAQPLEDVLND